MSIKSRARMALERLTGRSARALNKKDIDSATVISFDMFDTLVLRCCSKSYVVFDVMEEAYNKRHNGALKDFRNKRIEAEKLASIQAADQPIVLENIYNYLQDLGPQTANELMYLEVEVEKCLCRPNPEMKKLYDQLIADGKHVVITTDMYLSYDVIASILERCGYFGYKAIFLSSFTGVSKREGTQYEVLLEFMGVVEHPEKVIHIGDNIRSDYYMAQRYGLKAFLYRYKAPKTSAFRRRKGLESEWNLDEQLACDILHGVLDTSPHRTTIEDRVGYEVLGPMLLGYTMWLHSIINAKPIDKIWFLAREGKVLKSAYELVYPQENIPKFYIHVSRQSILRGLASQANSFEELESTFISLLRGVDTVHDFVKLIDPAISSCDLYNVGIDSSLQLKDIADGRTVFEGIRKLCGSLMEEQYSLLRSYLEAHGGLCGCAVISDIGWSGSMQVALDSLASELSTVGVYIACSDARAIQLDIPRFGYWCDVDEWYEKGSPIRYTIAAIEALFLNTEGTTIGYVSEGGNVKAVQAQNENSSDVCRMIDEMQKSALKFVEDCVAANLPYLLTRIPKYVAMLPWFNFGVYPGRDALEFYSKQTTMNVAGSYQSGIVPQHSLPYYIFRPRAAQEELERSSCKLMWLKGVLKIPLPYWRILQMLSHYTNYKSSYAKILKTSMDRRANDNMRNEKLR